MDKRFQGPFRDGLIFPQYEVNWDGTLSPAMGARNQVGIGLSYRPASLRSLAIEFQTQFLESIPRPIAGLKFPTLYVCVVTDL